MKNRKILLSILFSVLFLIIMYLTEQILKPAYLVKSLIKFFSITGSILAYGKLTKQKFQEVIAFRKMKPAKNLYCFMLAVFVIVLSAFFLLRNHLDFSAIRQNLVTKEQLTKQNCLLVFGYIILVNSFLEEAFFRGMLSHSFGEQHQTAGMLYSALLFAVYHLGIVDSWLSFGMLIFCIAGLFLAGIFLQWICNHYESLKASWLVHGCANLAINTIGFILIFFYT